VVRPSIVFTKNLGLWTANKEVKGLQQYLNAAGFTLAEKGAGSLGEETTFFGNLTKAALIRFQEAYVEEILTPVGLNKGTGFFGPSTRAYVNSLY
jgi:peptidoglycan hydrolase-like protein with peptidoglycan-binding domain